MTSDEFQPFPNTRWSLIRKVAQPNAAEQRDALAILLDRYQPALRSYLRVVRKIPQDEADEILQAYIADQILEHELIRTADESFGRFRTLLLKSLNNFVIDRARHARRRPAQSLPDGDHRSDAGPSPDGIVEAAWARALVHEVIAAMRRECQATRRPDIWLVFEGRILAEIFGTSPVLSYDALARQLQLQSPAQAANLLTTAKRMYARLLRQAVGEYEDDSAIDAEISELRHTLAADSSDHNAAHCDGTPGKTRPAPSPPREEP